MSKSEVHYRFPEQCCGTCDYAYMNTYNDACCKHLQAHDLVDYGAVCDLYNNREPTQIAIEPVAISLEERIDMEKGDCNDCKHSFLNGDIPMCAVDNAVIEEIGTCNAWEMA